MNWEEIERTLLTCDGVGKARKAEVLAQLKTQHTETVRLLERVVKLTAATSCIWYSSPIMEEIRAHLTALEETPQKS